MIDREKITLEWIEKVSKSNRNADKILVEKVIRALLLVEGMVNKDATKIEKYSKPLQMKEWTIGEPMHKKVIRLKKSNPEAFFFWYKIYELISA
ncbi:MAG: hypothetical protein WD052_03355 [Bacteroidales bacterium]